MVYIFFGNVRMIQEKINGERPLTKMASKVRVFHCFVFSTKWKKKQGRDTLF